MAAAAPALHIRPLTNIIPTAAATVTRGALTAWPAVPAAPERLLYGSAAVPATHFQTLASAWRRSAWKRSVPPLPTAPVVIVAVGRQLPSALQESAAAISRFSFEQSGSRRGSLARLSTSAAALKSGARRPAS
ncbi:MAG: hypothetical protein WDW38_000637 [Sanguina aurantia]